MPLQLKPCGSRAAYVRHRRHGEDPCDACVEDNRRYMQKIRELYAQLPADHVPHGRNGFTNYRCRCETCTEANKQRCAEDRQKRRERQAEA